MDWGEAECGSSGTVGWEDTITHPGMEALQSSRDDTGTKVKPDAEISEATRERLCSKK